jgi:hypothetical protein
VRIAFRGLHTDDAYLRGTAIEYVETALPEEIRGALLPFITGGEDSKAKPGPDGPDSDDSDNCDGGDVLERLMESGQSIELNLTELRKRLQSEGE